MSVITPIVRPAGKVTRSIILLILLSSISGCANLFSGNFFESFDSPPSASDIRGRYVDDEGNVAPDQAAAFVTDLGDAASSSRFFSELSDTDRADLRDSLASAYSSAEVPEATRQSAAILAADVTLRGADSGATINNVADVLTSSDGVDSFDEPSALLDQIVPESAQGDPVAIKRILDDMVAAAAAFDALGSTLTDSDGNGEIDNTPAGANMTAIAQQAAVAMVIRDLVADPDSGGAEGLADDIAAGVVDDTRFSDNPLSDTNTEGSPLNNILKAGGLNGVFDTES
jgi:hypothetical protein